MFRDDLKQSGYAGVNIVKELSDPTRGQEETEDQFWLHKSEYWVEKADVGFIVLLKDAKNDGVEQELRYLIDFHKDRIWRFNVLLERDIRLSSLVKGLIEDWTPELTQNYSKREEFSKFAKGRLINYVKKLYHEIEKRTEPCKYD
ncbi:MAG: hypothetical protein JRN32_03805 [Nitrososphaerota archaeon]|jgi:hypothetical protein|nr:hypothetical protein [Nitrososphaerota archaeon]MDG7045926.1 hypothetical protein [Nitrososphaerota archaeon]